MGLNLVDEWVDSETGNPGWMIKSEYVLLWEIRLTWLIDRSIMLSRIYSWICVSFPEKAEPVTNVNANTPGGELVSLVPAPSAPPPTLAMVSRQMGDSKPPQAIVKPQILTHIIEGFVIQEGAEPFPVRAWPWGGTVKWGLGLTVVSTKIKRLRTI